MKKLIFTSVSFLTIGYLSHDFIKTKLNKTIANYLYSKQYIINKIIANTLNENEEKIKLYLLNILSNEKIQNKITALLKKSVKDVIKDKDIEKDCSLLIKNIMNNKDIKNNTSLFTYKILRKLFLPNFLTD